MTGARGTVWLLLLLVLLVTGCRSVNPRRDAMYAPAGQPSSKMAGLDAAGATNQHKIIIAPKPDAPQPTRGQKWNPVWWFGNVDDPLPPDWYRPDDPHRERKWHWRNPCHNFNCYVIGIADKEYERVGKHPDAVFAPEGGWNWAVSRYRIWRLPFVSYQRGGFKFYLGWRERGNLGAKLNFTREHLPAAKEKPGPGP